MSSRNSSPARSIALTRLSRADSSRNSNDVKSSSYYPAPMSPVARMAIVDHMDSHYRRIQKAKAVVDTTPPRSFQMSRSSSPARSVSSRPNSRSSLRSNESQYTQINRQELIQSTSKINYYLEAMKREQQRLFNQLAATNFRRTKPGSNVSSSLLPQNRHKYHDLIEKHSESFTKPERPFVPRLLKSNAKSKLRENRCYNPPRRKGSIKSDTQEDFEDYEKEWEDDFSVNSRASSTKKLNGASSVEFNGKNMDNNLGQWLEEHVFSNDGSIHQSRAPSEEFSYQRRTVPSPKPIKNECLILSQGTSSKRKKEDSLPYLQFIVDVTNDILIRGIFTNKVLKQVFSSHVERRKNDLKMDEMEAALKQLQIDLGITDDNDNGVSWPSFGYGRQTHLCNGNGYKNGLDSTTKLDSPPYDDVVDMSSPRAGNALDRILDDSYRNKGTGSDVTEGTLARNDYCSNSSVTSEVRDSIITINNSNNSLKVRDKVSVDEGSEISNIETEARSRSSSESEESSSIQHQQHLDSVSENISKHLSDNIMEDVKVDDDFY